VRADVNTDAIAPIMNVVGREYRVGRVRSRPTRDYDQRPAAVKPTADPRLRTFCRARAGLCWLLGLAANGMERRHEGACRLLRTVSTSESFSWCSATRASSNALLEGDRRRNAES